MMRMAGRAFIFVLPAFLVTQACVAQLEDAEQAYRVGQYDTAIRHFGRLAAEPNAPARVHIGLARALSDIGRYGDAETALRAASTRSATLATGVANTLGEVLVLQGKLEAADSAFQKALNAPDAMRARLNRALLAYNRGEKDAALEEFDAFIDIYNTRQNLTSRDLQAVATAVQYLGETNPQLFKDALKAYDEAVAAAADNYDARVLLGEMFLDKYNGTDAQPMFQQVLTTNPSHARALLGMARAREFEGSPESVSLLDKALDVNPNLVPARVVQARALLGVEDYDGAIEELKKALAVNPASLEARSYLASAHYQQGNMRAFEEEKQRVLAQNPRYARLFTILANNAVMTRQYREAVAFAEKAIALDAVSWEAHGVLGINRMRIGLMQEGRASLEAAFKGDPYNPWFKNTLDLLDTLDKYRTTSNDRFAILNDPREADLLGPYALELADSASKRLGQRYKTQLPGPVRIEMFRSHADFSVRTVGLAGMGALGVAFGNLLAMDSPSAREGGDFNWGSTLWHEMAHAYHMHLSKHRVPRWLTEGLAVLEERRARPGWGDDVTPQFIAAYREGLEPVSRMNTMFVRPETPQHLGYAYFQASLVAEMIEQQKGMDAIIAMLKAYGAGKTGEQVFREVLNVAPAAFDRQFDQWVRQKYAKQLQSVRSIPRRAADVMRASDDQPADGLITQLRAAREKIEAKDFAEAIVLLERAKESFPEYAGADSPYRLLATIYEEQGDSEKAIAELEKQAAINESDLASNLKLAELHGNANNAAGAAAALDRAMYISPLDIAAHQKLAELAAQLGNRALAVRERRAVVALNPADRAEALYQLALAYLEAGDSAAARREILRALEDAPNFEKAQELLLRIRGGGRS